MVEQTVPTNLGKELQEFLAEQPVTPFNWSDHHCAAYVARWIKRLTGVNHMQVWPEMKNATAKAQYREVRKQAGSLQNLVTRQLGQHFSVSFAQVGDIVYRPTKNGRAALGICNGRLSMFLAEEGGVRGLPTMTCTVAWRIKLA